MKLVRRPRRSINRSAASRRAQQLHLLQEVSHQIAAALDVRMALDRLVQTIHTTLGYPIVSTALIEGEQLVFHSVATTPPARLPASSALPLDGPGLTVWAARHGQPVLASDVAADPRYRLYELLPDTRSEMVVPLAGRSGVLGVIDIQSDLLAAFDQHDLSLITTLAAYAATAIENARLYQAEQERRRELEALQSITLRLSGDLDLETVLSTVVAGSAGIFNADATGILMPDPASDHLIVRSHYQLPASYAEILRIPGRELNALIEQWGSAGILELPSQAGEELIQAEASELAEFASTVSCRLMAEGAFVGVLCVYSRAPRRFSGSERHMLGALAQQAALAISNARRYQHERLLVADLEHSYNEML
jgi:GAF domain-containing protein